MPLPSQTSPHDGVIAFVYRHVLSREATSDEISAWSTEMNNGLSCDVFLALVSASDEAASAAEINVDAALATIGNVFCQVKGRNPSPDDVTYWTEQSKRGRSVASLVDEILDSPEARRRAEPSDPRRVESAIAFVYRHALGREPNAADRALWSKHLEEGLSFPAFPRRGHE